MGYFSVSGIKMAGVSVALPAQIETNDALGLMNEREKIKFEKTVGIKSRRVAPRDITAADLCTAAAEKLLGEAGVRPDEIETVIFVSQTPDFLVPGSATQIQARLGIPKQAMAMDINQGCAGYVYGLGTMAALQSVSRSPYALLLVGDTITHTLSEKDKSTRPIFSDAGSATLLQYDPEAAPMHFHLQGKGEGFKAIHIPDGGARQPFSESSLKVEEQEGGLFRAACHLEMRGVEVFHFALSEVAPNITALLEQADQAIESVDYFVFHQANLLLNESIRKKLRLPANKVPYSMGHLGNTSSATVPVTMVDQLRSPLREKAQKLVLSGFGVGLSWGAACLETQPMFVPEPVIL